MRLCHLVASQLERHDQHAGLPDQVKAELESGQSGLDRSHPELEEKVGESRLGEEQAGRCHQEERQEGRGQAQAGASEADVGSRDVACRPLTSTSKRQGESE